MPAVTRPASTARPGGSGARRRIRVRGLVQGVGFRPFVHRLATELGLAGHVGNDVDGVFVEVQGPSGVLDRFEGRLTSEAPPLARVDAVESTPLDPDPAARDFCITASRSARGVQTLVAPDVAVCDDCLAEVFDPADRRYRHPFVTCTNCGPRFTITVRLPYDRPNTTMAGFPLCPACATQYHDPADRRFHAQPLACPACGPTLWFDPARESSGGDGNAAGGSGHPRGTPATDAALAAAQRALASGAIVAAKGVGGYHLACDATDDTAVGRLRRRKARPAKPFAVMVPDLAAAERLAHLDRVEAALLSSPARPIVLLAARPASPLSDLVAPGNPLVGIMLPYTALHHLLLRPVPGHHARVPGALVMTSGNLSDEPIAYEDADARRRLGTIADAWLVHDRPIHVPCDDSVVRVVGGRAVPIRRSRGYAPIPVELPTPTAPLLAVGAELKNTFCLAAERRAWMSQHVGDMGSVETLAAFERSTAQFRSIYQVEPATVAADAHPGYHTRRWAEARSGRPEPALVQHHHAHAAALMAEHGLGPGERIVGVVFDGTGYGTDGAIWGGEVLVAGYARFERAAHLRYVPLPGGDATVHRPYRAALAHLWAAGLPWDGTAPARAAGAAERRMLERQFDRGVRCVPTSSMGRLFDAVASLLGIRHEVSYEAQAAMELEALAAAHLADHAPEPGAATYRFATDAGEIDPRPMLRALVGDAGGGAGPDDRPGAGLDRPAAAAGFHAAVARAVADVAGQVSAATGLSRVGLTGGVFQNAVLLGLTTDALTARGLDVLVHRVVPPNDGGLALGQAMVAAARAGGERP
jgi:hydrogenase maturation protein HypF